MKVQSKIGPAVLEIHRNKQIDEFKNSIIGIMYTFIEKFRNAYAHKAAIPESQRPNRYDIYVLPTTYYTYIKHIFS